MLRVTPSLQTSPVFRIKGQRSRWRYPNERVSPENPLKLRNVNLTERGTAATRFGYTKYNSTVLTGPEAGVGLKQVDFTGTLREYVVTPSKVYMDNGTTRKNITGSALTGTANDRARILMFADYAVINNGVDQIQLHDGDWATPSVCTDLTGMPWTKVRDHAVHRNLYVVARPTESGVDMTTRIRWCDVNRRTFVPDIGTWLDTNRTEIYGGGAPIIGLVENWDRLWVFKRDGAYTGQIVTNVGRFEYEPMDVFRGFEPVSKDGLVVHPNFIFGVAREGCFVITRDGQMQIITDDISDEWQGLNLARLQYAQARIRERDHQVRVLLSASGTSVGFDQELVWDWDTGDVWIDPLTNAMGYGERILVSNEELDWYVSNAGFLYKGNVEGQLTDDGTDIEWEIEMSPNDLGLPGRTKEIVQLRTYFRTKPSAQTVELNVTLDQGRQTPLTKSLTVGSTLTYNDGTSTYNSGLKYPGGTNQIVPYWVNRQVETFAPRWKGTDPVDLVGYDVTYRVLE